ncbi:hypothetical protein [Parafilimonas terrae]|uniref:Uncharacterized protein n=1 Tax=Parafilimonas terrae TaxID=1465490 RepID=A0A1I5ZI51_9BACT|nr:hypothetical protein [Parafilimonas terrae]SFQ55817.1 hypothetical protein SAMN05444277_1293 [Parafilimonas terrae]
MEYNELSDKQLIDLAKLRLKNDGAKITITKITIEDKRRSAIHDEFAVSFIVKSKEWADERLSIVFKKFYPNEFLFLQKVGIKFKL